MNFQLVLNDAATQSTAYPLDSGKTCLVGRGAECHVQLADPNISRVHCRISVDGSSATIEDAESRWGTEVNGQPVTQHQLLPGDTIRLGKTNLQFEVIASAEATTIMPPARNPVVDVAELQKDSPAGVQPAAKRDTLESLVGTTLNRYEIKELLARGQTGYIFRAQDPKKEQDIALKVFLPELTTQREEMQRIVRSVKTMQHITHDNLLQLYGAGISQQLYWMAMEYVPGENMLQVIKRIGIGGMLPWEYAYRVGVHISRALEVAFEHNIVHRNITPRNILIRKADRVVKLGDLILAKALGNSQASNITVAGEIVGDLAYLSPEQTTGQGIDHRSDIYCLGATLYALLTGRPPHAGRNVADLIMKIQEETPKSLTEYQLSVPGMFEGIIRTMLAKRPEERYDNATVLLAELDRLGKFQNVAVD